MNLLLTSITVLILASVAKDQVSQAVTGWNTFGVEVAGSGQ